jgi:membrane-bound acyltransferase YfiQ involved in biofilm formation
MNRRYAEVDFVKAVGILVVPLIHCLRPAWSRDVSSSELFLGNLLHFAVPGFLAASGFLYAASESNSWRATLRRLGRVLIPYLLASTAAEIFHAVQGQPHTMSRIIEGFFFGAAFGPYYFVFVITVLVILTPLFARLPHRGMIALTLLMLSLQACQIVDMAIRGLPEFEIFSSHWKLRSPVIWWSYFLLAWLARLHYDRLSSWVVSRRLPLTAVLVALSVCFAGVHWLEITPVVVRLGSWFYIFSILMLICTLSCGLKRVPKPIRFLSDVTYSLYLFHLFFVYTAQDVFPHAYRALDPMGVLVPWAAGLVGALLVIMLGRRLLGRHSRTYLGA